VAPERHVLERLFVQETLVDILLDTADVQEAMKSPGQNRARLYAQRAKQVDVKHRLEMVTRQAEEVLPMIENDDDGEAEFLVDRISRVHTAVALMKDVVLVARRRSITAGRYGEAAEAWRSGVRPYDSVARPSSSSRLNVGRVAPSTLVGQLYVVPDSQPNSEGDENEGAVDYGADSQEEKCDDDVIRVDGCGLW